MVFMQRALLLAKLGQYTCHPNPRVGCVLVKDGKIIGEGLHWQRGQAHAEINALNSANDAKGATCYVTLEPCAHQGRTAPCVDALIASGIKKVVVAVRDPNPQVCGKGIAQLKAAGILVEEGVLEEEARALNSGFFSRMLTGRPYVRVKVAMSLDGKVAMAGGESQWITDDLARKDGQRWRAKSGAILCGAQSVLKDNCRLTVRDEDLFRELPENVTFAQPLRVVVDSKLALRSDCAIFHQPGKTVIATLEKNLKGKEGSGEYIVLPEKSGYVDLKALMDCLGEQEINDLLVESGPGLVSALLEQRLVDELLIYVASKILGEQARGFAPVPGIEKLKDHIPGEFVSVEQFGKDLALRVKIGQRGYS